MKPASPKPGDSIGLIAPASLPVEPRRISEGVRTLEARGFEVVRFREHLVPRGYLAGGDSERLEELNTALRADRPSVIFCVRGGYGTLRLLDGIDYEAAAASPKVLVGYSDITALQLALYARSGTRGLSGSMVAVDWVDPFPESESIFWKLLDGTAPIEVEGPNAARLRGVCNGSAEGVLIGGNPSMIARLLGTPYLPNLDGAILFVEDVGEPPYRVDGLLAHLRLSGVLDRLGGLVFGAFSGWVAEDDRPTLTYDEVIADYAARLNIPVAAGLAYGHIRAKHAMPIGVSGRLTVSDASASLTILESLTS